MKRMFALSAVLLALQLPSFAQNASSAAALADKQESEERYKRMAADVEALQAANSALQKRIGALEDKISKLSEETARANSTDHNAGVRDDLKMLRDKIQEVDKKRESDKQVISDELKKSIADIERLLKSSPRHSPKPVEADTKSADPAPSSEKGFVHVIQEGEFLSTIVKAYNAKFKSEGMKTISIKQVRDANPKVDWNRLQIGQKIVIPAPPQ